MLAPAAVTSGSEAESAAGASVSICTVLGALRTDSLPAGSTAVTVNW